MNENVKFFEQRADALVIADRLQYFEFYKEIEHFAEDANLIACNKFATRLTFPKKINMRDLFAYEFFGDLDLTKELAKRLADIKNPLGYEITVRGANWIHQIWVNQRILVHVHEMPKIRGHSVLKIIMPKSKRGLFGTKLLCVGAEIQLIKICSQLTNPANFGDWEDLLKDFYLHVDDLFEGLHDRLKNVSVIEGGGKRPIIDKKIMNPLMKYIKSKNFIILQQDERLQVVTDMDLDDVSRDIAKIIEKTGTNLEFNKEKLKVPTDSRLTRLSMHVVKQKLRMPLIDVFNIAEYELVPYIRNWEATGFLKMRCKLVDTWVILTLARSGTLPEQRVTKLLFETERRLHKIVADMANIPRTQAKTINLGLFYGMGKNKLQAELGVNKLQAEELFKQYHSKVPFVKQLMDAVMSRAQRKGKVRTLLGRLCRFHLWEPNQFGIHKPLPHDDALAEHGPGIRRAYTYKALNRLIQGSAADMTKKAMIDLHAEGIIPHLQVHDELDISIQNKKEAEKIKDIMESTVSLEVPNKVDYEEGDNWGSIK